MEQQKRDKFFWRKPKTNAELENEIKELRDAVAELRLELEHLKQDKGTQTTDDLDYPDLLTGDQLADTDSEEEKQKEKEETPERDPVTRKYKCPCGSVVKNLAAHRETKKHKDFLLMKSK